MSVTHNNEPILTPLLFLLWTSHQCSFGTVPGKLCQVKSSSSSFPPPLWSFIPSLRAVCSSELSPPSATNKASWQIQQVAPDLCRAGGGQISNLPEAVGGRTDRDALCSPEQLMRSVGSSLPTLPGALPVFHTFMGCCGFISRLSSQGGISTRRHFFLFVLHHFL